MGLIFSVLVVCVGVYKFIQIYCDTEKKVGYETKEISRTDNVSKNNLASGSTPRVQLCRDFLSHEDVEVECTAQVLSHSRSPSPRRFLVTERNNSNSRTPSPRKFVISEDDASISNLREFLIAKGIPKNNPDTKRFVLIDTKKDFKEVSPLPLPQQFVITQATPAIVHETIANIKQGIGIDLKSLSFNGQEIETLQTVSKNIVDEAFLGALSSITPNSDKPLSFSITKPEDPQSYSVSTKNSSSRSLETLQENQASTSLYAIYNQEPEEFHRDASPYPSLDVPIRRGSISSELLDNPKISVAEIDEEAYSSANKIDVILNSPNFNTTEYWSNKVLVIPPKKSTSGTHSPSFYYDGNDYSVDESTHQHHNVNETKQRSKSATRNNGHSSNTDLRKISSSSKMYDGDFQEPSSLFINVLKKGEDEEFRNSLDGVKRGSEARRSFKKKKNRSQNSLENEENCEEGNKKGQEKTTAPEISRLIFSGEYTKAMNKDWHGQHFCCWQCDESLTGQRYVLRDDHPYCVSCYESVFANACEKCSRIIGIDSKDLSYKDKHWHEACFLCTTCGESLVDKQFGSKGDRIYCGRCYDNQFASRCDGCNEIFRAGTKKMEYKTRQWHEKCFCCCVCKVPIGTQSFIPREQEIYCAKCYEEKFATRCIKCNKVITSGGVTYKNEPWHRECFTCTNCSKSLAGERFTSRDEKPYCAECFGELFAKRCFACNKPITGIGGTKFISFEDRHWHNDCFFCASCRTSLVGRGFITDQDDIICPDCAKQKLL